MTIAAIAIVTLVAGAALTVRLRKLRLAARLVCEANALAATPRTRSVHVDKALPGALGEKLVRHLPAVDSAWAELAKNAESMGPAVEIVLGTRSPKAMPPLAAATLALAESDLNEVLQGTRSESPDLVYGEDEFHPAPGVNWLGCYGAAFLAGLRARRSLADGRAVDAARDCLDGLALARDATFSGTIVGSMIATAIVTRLHDVCDAAIGDLPERERMAAVQHLRTIRGAMLPVPQVVRGEAACTELCIWGRALPSKMRDTLAERPRRQAASTTCAAGAWENLLRDAAWARWRELHDAMIVAAALPISERDRAFEALAQSAERHLLAKQLPNPREFLMYARRIDSTRLRLDLLVAGQAARTYRSSHGHWPGTADALLQAGLLDASEGERLRALQFSDPSAPDLVLEFPFALADTGNAQLRIRADTQAAGHVAR